MNHIYSFSERQEIDDRIEHCVSSALSEQFEDALKKYVDKVQSMLTTAGTHLSGCGDKHANVELQDDEFETITTNIGEISDMVVFLASEALQKRFVGCQSYQEFCNRVLVLKNNLNLGSHVLVQTLMFKSLDVLQVFNRINERKKEDEAQQIVNAAIEDVTRENDPTFIVVSDENEMKRYGTDVYETDVYETDVYETDVYDTTASAGYETSVYETADNKKVQIE